MTKGPWLENAMWTPDEDTPDAPKVVREHYFIVCAQVREDGSYKWNADVCFDILNTETPVYVLPTETWERVTNDLTEEDSKFQNDLFDRLR